MTSRLIAKNENVAPFSRLRNPSKPPQDLCSKRSMGRTLVRLGERYENAFIYGQFASPSAVPASDLPPSRSALQGRHLPISSVRCHDILYTRCHESFTLTDQTRAQGKSREKALYLCAAVSLVSAVDTTRCRCVGTHCKGCHGTVHSRAALDVRRLPPRRVCLLHAHFHNQTLDLALLAEPGTHLAGEKLLPIGGLGSMLRKSPVGGAHEVGCRFPRQRLTIAMRCCFCTLDVRIQ
jgi:hypothetical protein